MTSVRSWAALASVGLAVSAATVASGVPAAASTSSGRAAMSGSLTPAVERSARQGGVASGAQVSFDLNLSLRNAAEARALSTAVSTPGSAQYRHFMTTAPAVARFAPMLPAVSSAELWLRQAGCKVGSVPSACRLRPAVSRHAHV